MTLQELLDKAISVVLGFIPNLVGAILVLVFGWWLVNRLVALFSRTLERRHADASLIPFLRSTVRAALRVLLFFSVVGILGVETTSFIAALGAAGLAIGMALSGTLQNFAGGIIILLFRPYRVGDVIEANGYLGTVKEIQVFNTILNTFDNKVVVIPNAQLSNNSLVNYSTEELRRVDIVFGIGYGDSFEKARAVLLRIISEEERILKAPEPFIGIDSLGTNSVNIVTRSWVLSKDYWAVYFHLHETVYRVFAEEGLNIPFPQMDVHLHQVS